MSLILVFLLTACSSNSSGNIGNARISDDTIFAEKKPVAESSEEETPPVVEEETPPVVEEETPPSPPVQEETPPSPPIQETTPPSPPVQETTPPSPPAQEETPPSPPVVEEETPPSPPVQETTPPSPPVVEEETPPSPPVVEEETPPSPPVVEEETPPSPPAQETTPPSPPVVEEETPPSPPPPPPPPPPPKTPPSVANFAVPSYFYHPIRSRDNKTKKHKEIMIERSAGNGVTFISTADEQIYNKQDLFSGTNYHESLSAYISVSRDDAFSFKPKYMAHIGWDMQQIISYDAAHKIAHPDDSVRQEVERLHGNIIEGYYTPYHNVFDESKGTINFIGKGRGLYIINKQSVDYQDYETIFDVNAAIDFSKRKVNLQVSNTKACRQNVGIVNCTTNATGLDFTKKLSYGEYDDYASGSISLSLMTGSVNVQFFGSKLEEIGGTFYASGTNNGDSYDYSGYFGTRRDWIYQYADDSVSGNDIYNYAPLFTNPEDEPQFGDIVVVSASFSDASDEANKKNKNIIVTTEDVLMVERVVSPTLDGTGKAIFIRNQSIPAISIAFDDGGRITAAGVYFDDSNTKTYRSQQGSSYQTTSHQLKTNKIHEIDADSASGMRVYRGATYDDGLGNETKINTQYMVSVEWLLHKGADNPVRGIGLAGFQTEFNKASLPNTGTVQFNGVSKGYYESNASGLFEVHSRIVAEVNFNNKNVNLSSVSTRCKNYIQCDISGINSNGLDFSTTLNYQGSNNLRRDNVRSDDGSVTGTVQARFYGPQAEEFGGVFGMKNNNGSITYRGSFFTKR